MTQKITLVGGGLAGSLLAIYFAKRNFDVTIYEKRPDMRKEGYIGGRSINLALSHRGLSALRKLGVLDEVLPMAIPMQGRVLHDPAGNLAYFPYGKDNSEYINSISRGGLNIALMNLAEKYPNIKLVFDEECKDIDFNTNIITFQNSQTHETQSIKADVVIATDGAGSAIRNAMTLRLDGYTQNTVFLAHGYKELEIPAKNNTFQIEKNALHIWPRGTYMMIALPNLDGSFTVTLFFPNKGENSFESLDTKEKVQDFFSLHFKDALDIMPDLAEDFFNNPTGGLATLYCTRWNVEGKVLLLGDAAHAIVPFYGQGMNASFEDCIILDDCLEKHNVNGHANNWEEIFEEYTKMRKKDTDAIGELAIENFYEMRDKVADPNFQKMRKIEHKLENAFSEYHSKYSMVTFHPEIPYSEAKRKGNLQNDFLLNICKNNTDIDSIDIVEVYQQIKDL